MISKIKIAFYHFFLSIATIVFLVSCNSEAIEESKSDENKIILAKDSEDLKKIMSDPKSDIIRNHYQLLDYIQKDEILSKYFDEELTHEFMYQTYFNEKGLMTYNFSEIKKRYPDYYKKILIQLSKGFGYDYGSIAEDHEGYACTSTATCTTQMNAICIGQNCAGFPDYKDPLDIIDLIKTAWLYTTNFLDKDYLFYNNKNNTFPIRQNTDWFFENFNLKNLELSDKTKEALAQGIKKEQVIVFGNPIVTKGEKIMLATLVFTKGFDITDELKDTPGLIIDSKTTENCTNLCLWGSYGGDCSGCWTISCCNATSCNPCSSGNINLEDIMNRDLWYSNLDVLSGMPLSTILPEQPLLEIPL